MKFSDLYKNGQFRYSVELFPPKSPEGVDALIQEVKRLCGIQPAYFSVTYGAMGSTRDLTKNIVLRLKKETKVPIASHFTCIASNRDQIKRYIEEILSQGVDLIVALRGDIPGNLKNYVPSADGFSHANELVTFLKTHYPQLSIAVAGYPEKHLEAASSEEDLKNLQRKVEAGADVIITQLFFDNEDFFNFVQRVRERGIKVPILPGILPVQNLKQVEKFTQMCGAKFPKPLQQRLINCQNDANQMKAVGVEHATSQCRELIAKQVTGIHFYSLNKADSVLKIVANTLNKS